MKLSGTLATGFALACAIGLSAPATATSLIFDRGLPTANLNDGAGANRSNIAWAEPSSGEASPPSVSIGDNFTLSAASNIDTIRVWVLTTGDAPAANAYQLWLGADAGAASTVANIATSSSVSLVTYADLSNYQGSAGSLNLYEVDFSGLNLYEDAGTYAFGVSGQTETGNITPYLSASNGPLSGSPQMGDDGVIYAFTSLGQMSTANGYPYATVDGWDKSSDINVQVEGDAVPEPASLALLGGALAGLAALRRRKKI